MMNKELSSVRSESPARSIKNEKKRTAEQAELEVDLNAPEPLSKKALRKAKKGKNDIPDDAGSLPNKQSGALKPAKEDINNSGKRTDYGIWIGNLSFTTTREDLFEFMTSDAEHVISKEKVTRVNLPLNRAKNGKSQNKGFAYIDLADSVSHASALELSEKLLGGRRVLIKDSKSFEGRPQEGAKETSSHPPSKRIFIGNLGFDTDVGDLEKHFSVCGPIAHTHMATFEDSGKCKGYAWLEFEQLPAAQAAMRGWIEEGGQQEASSDGVQRSKRRIWLHKIDGRKLRLEFAEDKATRYQKRYGKNGQKGEVGSAGIEEANSPTTTVREDINSNGAPRRESKNTNYRADKKPKVRKNGYAEDTVQRLTGAIVEGKGNKVTFD